MQSGTSTTGESPLRLAHPSRVPAVPVALALAAGIAVDRALSIDLEAWLAAAWSIAILGVLAQRCGVGGRWYSIVLLIGIALLGAARHHAVWSVRPIESISRYSVDEPRLVAMEGTLIGAPWIRPRPEISRTAWPEFDRTQFDLDVDGVQQEDGVAPVTGRVRVTITGHLPNLRAGDRIRMHGWLAAPRPPSNPGEFDYPEWLRAKGVRAVAWANHPDAVSRTERGSPFELARIAARIRTTVERTVNRSLDAEVAPIAAALLVGTRSRVPDETREAFAESGTLHLLAISGLHVGILAGFVWFLCRSIGMRVGTTTCVLLCVLVVYSVLTGARPSVVRASVFVAVAVLGPPWQRRVSAFQLLGLAAILLLAWRPTDLFDTGAQLSFLAVAAIAFVSEWQRSREPSSERVGDLVERGPIGRISARLCTAVVASWLVMTAIWLFTAPLVANTFHLVSPAGLLLNVLLVPAVAVVMWCGYAFVLASLVLGPVSDALALPFGLGLHLLLDVARWASTLSLGHRYISGPAAWWVGGFHLGLLGLLFAVRRPRWRTRVAVGLMTWTVVGCVWTQAQDSPGSLRCTFLSVGHGSAVLVELPNGRTLLYDGGSLTSPDFADRVIRSAVWDAGHSRLDAVVVSHADVDHFNALVDVVRAVPMHMLYVSQPFLDFEQGFVAELCDTVAARGAEIALVHGGDDLRLDSDVSIRLMHPRAGSTYGSDNAASIVLLVEFAGCRVLLTGDIEKDGLEQLLDGPPIDVDVLASPHHGSRAANTDALASWATPEFVVVSAGSRARPETLRETFPAARLLTTDEHGAVTFTITADGRLDCQPFRE